MVLTHDTEVALRAVAALVNTDRPGGDLLPDVTALRELAGACGWGAGRPHTPAELTAVRTLRPRLRRIWEADQDEVVRIVNRLLDDSHALPQLIRHDGWPYHLHATPLDGALDKRFAVEAAMAFADVIREEQLSRLRVCDQAGCGNVVVDLSRNRSKRFCDTGCGNRAAAGAYRARKAAAVRPD